MAITPQYLYSWAAGWDVPLVSLVNVETDLEPYTLPALGITIAPNSPLVDLFPIRTPALSGRTRGDGFVFVNWVIGGLPELAEKYIEDTYCDADTGDPQPMTIYTRMANRGIYKRFNAWLSYPQAGVDYNYDSGFMLPVTLHFTDLIPLEEPP